MLSVSLFAISVRLEIIFEKVKKKRIFNTLGNESTLTILKIIFDNIWFCENFIAALSTQHDLEHILKFYMARLWQLVLPFLKNQFHYSSFVNLFCGFQKNLFSLMSNSKLWLNLQKQPLKYVLGSLDGCLISTLNIFTRTISYNPMIWLWAITEGYNLSELIWITTKRICKLFVFSSVQNM